MAFNNLFEEQLAARQDCADVVEARARDVRLAQNMLNAAKNDFGAADENLFKAALSRVKHIVTVASNTYLKENRHIAYGDRPVVPGLEGFKDVRVIDWETARFEQLSNRRLTFTVSNEGARYNCPADRYSIAVPLEWFGLNDGDITSQIRRRVRAEIKVKQMSFWRKELRFVEGLVQMWEEVNQRDEKPDNAEAVLAGFVNERDILKERLANG